MQNEMPIDISDKQSEQEVYYTCRKCSTRLFDRSEVLHEGTSGHEADGVGVSDVKASWGRQSGSYQHGLGGTCSSVFTAEAPEWVTELVGNEGRITCPNCSSRVGSFAWSGAPCSCGKWVTPAFQFQLSRVDPKGLVQLPSLIPIRQPRTHRLPETSVGKAAVVKDGKSHARGISLASDDT